MEEPQFSEFIIALMYSKIILQEPKHATSGSEGYGRFSRSVGVVGDDDAKILLVRRGTPMLNIAWKSGSCGRRECSININS
jgi:hypothetical protein